MHNNITVVFSVFAVNFTMDMWRQYTTEYNVAGFHTRVCTSPFLIIDTRPTAYNVKATFN